MHHYACVMLGEANSLQ